MAVKVFGYKQGSKSAKALAEALGGKVLKHVGSKYRPKAGDTVVNWGSAVDMARFGPATVLNVDVTKAQCKLASFRALNQAGVRVPTFSTRKEDFDEGDFPVVCRTKLRGHSGDGIVIANNKDELVAAPLYTKYVKKKDEYRIHVLGGRAFFCQRKARKLENEQPNWQIRNLAGGFVFVETEINDVPADVLDVAIRSVTALGLDFGGADVMWNENEGRAYALEVNTACGLEERTAQKYKEAISDFLAAPRA